MRKSPNPQATGRYERSGHEYFAKVVPLDHEPRLKAEREGLDALRATATVRVPRWFEEGRDDERSWVLLEWLELGALAAAGAAALGVSLAALHRTPQKRFGWERDNFIGGSVQLNGWSEDWVGFWQEKRLMAQLRLAARNRLPSRLMDRGERLAADCGAFFRSYAPQPSLLHGDLWGGNASSLPDGTPVVFDPAVYVGDREADLAMTTLFGGFPADFQSAYRAAWPLDDGYRVRRDFYNLYHVLNHANLFAGGYVRQSQELVERLIAEIA
jgi:protein-ribulosamine 3-kinase